MYIVHGHNVVLYTNKQTLAAHRTKKKKQKEREKRKREKRGKYRKYSAQLLTLGDEQNIGTRALSHPNEYVYLLLR